jgi:hypothetical protein
MRRFMGGGSFQRLGTSGGVEIATAGASKARMEFPFPMVRVRGTADVRTAR